LHGVSFKKRAPKAIKEIKAFALQAMVRYEWEAHEESWPGLLREEPDTN
jgi:hypothetical protein